MSALPATPRDYPVFTSTGIIECRTGRQVVVQLSASAQRDIFRLSTESGGLETGGGLYSTSTLGDPLAIVRAGAPGRSFKPRQASLTFDMGELDGPGFTGFWHSHPRPGSDKPSVPDLECCQRMRDVGIRPIRQLVCLIATPGADSPNLAWDQWKKPQIGAWLVGDGYYQRAVLTVTPDPPNARAPKLARSRGRLLIATRTFTTTYDGEPVQITAGERLSGDHPIARRHPDAFKVAT